MSLFVFNNQQKLIKSIPNRDLISVVQDQAINVSDTLFVEMPADIWGNLSEPASYLAVQDPYERFIYHMYKVSKHTTKADTTDIEAIQIGYDELKAYGYIKDRRFSNRPVLEAATAIVDGTDWQLGYVDTDLPNVNTNFYYISRLEALSKLIEATGAEVRFRVEISGNKIIAKRLDLYKQLGTFKGKRFAYGSNLLEIIKEEDTSELYTALVGRGKGEETDTGGFGRRITFADIAWSKSSGKPVDKPLGQEFIELPEMTAYYGYPDGEPRTGIVEFGDIEEPELLLKATYDRLVETSRPQVQFKAKVQTTGDMQLGEEVAIIRSDLGFRYKTRVFRVKRDYLNNMFTEVELGDKLTETLASRIKKIDTTNARREETIIQYIQTAANGKNKIFRGVLEPTEGMMVNDLWYKPVGEGETEMYQWNGAIWELILSTLDTTKVQQEVDAAIEQADADRAKAEVDANQALADAKAHADGEIERINTELSTDIGGAIGIAEQAKQDAIDKANQAYDDAVAEADRLAASRDDKITINAGQITAGVIDAARLDAVSIVTKGLTANVIKSTHIETSTATIEKLFADDATVNSLTSKTAFINSIKAVEIDASKITSGTIDTARLDAKEIITEGLVANVIKSTHIQADTALFDKLFTSTLATDRLSAQTAWIKNGMFANASIDGAKIANATIGSAKIISLDVSKLSGQTITGINYQNPFSFSYEGKTYSGTTVINNGGIGQNASATDGTPASFRVTAGEVSTQIGNRTTNIYPGRIRFTRGTGERAMIFYSDEESLLYVNGQMGSGLGAYRNYNGEEQFTPILKVVTDWQGTSRIIANARINAQRVHFANGGTIYDSGDTFLMGTEQNNINVSIKSSQLLALESDDLRLNNRLIANNAVRIRNYNGQPIIQTLINKTGVLGHPSTWLSEIYVNAMRGETLNIGYGQTDSSKGDLRVDADADGGRLVSNAVYNRTSSNPSNVGVTSYGMLYRVTSAKKYKTDIVASDMSHANKVLFINPKNWIDKNGVYPGRQYGFIADEFHELGLTEVVQYGSDGQVEGLAYDRISMYHNVILQDHERQLSTVTQQLDSVDTERLQHSLLLESKLLSLENSVLQLQQEIEQLRTA